MFEILKTAANVLNDGKAEELFAVKVTEITSLADYFLMATATSSTQVRSLSEKVEEKLKKIYNIEPKIEGRSTDWLLLDYGFMIVHIFGRQSREFYSLDKMWNDGEVINLEEILENEME